MMKATATVTHKKLMVTMNGTEIEFGILDELGLRSPSEVVFTLGEESVLMDADDLSTLKDLVTVMELTLKNDF